MNIYKVKFNSYCMFCEPYINDKDFNKISCNSHGEVLLLGDTLSDIDWINKYGQGILSVICLGIGIQKKDFIKENI